MKEKHATRVPTVLIGIGGIGGEIVRLVHQDLRQYDKQFVQMLVLDTNTNDLKKSSKLNISYVQTSENQTVSDYLRQNKRFQAWFPPNPLINAKNLTQGAGQIRSVSRLGALSSESAHRFDTIRQAIEKVNVNVGDNMHNMTRVMIVGSVCGGTGSGMAIQLPFLIRDLIEEAAHMPRTIIRGLFLMPDILEDKQDTDPKKKSVYVNGYAFLRELNAFNKAQTFQRGTEKLDIEHYRRDLADLREDPTQMSHEIPYDFLFLLEKTDTDGRNIGGSDAYISKAAQIVKAQLFASDMTADLMSSEDNLIVSAVDRGGMNRFCGAGISKMIYPEEENLRYCVLRYSESILQSYWLRIDRDVDVNMAQHKRQMASDHSLMPKDPKEEYIKTFDELTDPTRSDVTVEMGFLKRELTYEVETTDKNDKKYIQSVNQAVNLCNAIGGYIDELYNWDDNSASKTCKMDRKALCSQNASTYCSNQLKKLRRYEKDVKERVGKLTSGAIEAILGSDPIISESYNDAMKYPHNICAVIKDKHPIVARYILYFVQKNLKERILKADSEITSCLDEETIFQKDYYKDKEKIKKGEEDTHIDDPSEALTRTKPGLLSVFGINSSEYKNLVETIVQDTDSFIVRVNNLNKNRLIKTILTTVIKRIDVLISIYEEFFDELEKIMNQNRADREVLERVNNRIQGSNIYICADPDCKEWLYNTFERKTTGADITLPEDVKLAFFDSVFKEYANKYKAIVDKTAFTDKPLSMRKLFESAILKPLTNKFKNKEMAHIHMDVITALETEYKIHSQKGILHAGGSAVNSDDFDFEQYFESVAVQLKNLSSPYLSYSTVSEEVNNLLQPNADVEDVALDPDSEIAATALPTQGRVLCYWGINNGAVARYQNKDSDENIDSNALSQMFGSANGASYFFVNDDSFDPKELVCYSSVYDLLIENLDKYKKGSRAYKEYHARLLRVIKSDFKVGTGASAYLDTVHPHLDRHWHAHAYLPKLCINEEVEEQKRIAKAFLLSLACRRVWYIQIDRTPCWAFLQTNNKVANPLTIHDKPALRSSFHTLYETMDENTVAVNDILRKVLSEEKKAYDSVRIGGVRPEDILDHPIIKGFIGDNYSEADLNDLETIFKNIYASQNTAQSHLPINVLRVIYSVYQDSFDLELVTALVDNLTEYLNGYCLKMANNQKGAAGVLFKSIAKAIGSNFNTTNVDLQFLMLCDTYLK